MLKKNIFRHGIHFGEAEIAAFCRKNGIARLLLFGSVLRDDFGPGSDVDMLVEFLPGEPVGLLRLMRIERELAGLLGVIKVDLRVPDAFEKDMLERVVSQSEALYVQG